MTRVVSYGITGFMGCFDGRKFLGLVAKDETGKKFEWVIGEGTENQWLLRAITPTDYFKDELEEYPVVSTRRPEFRIGEDGCFELLKPIAIQFSGCLWLLKPDRTSVLLGEFIDCGHHERTGFIPNDDYWEYKDFTPCGVAPFRILRTEGEKHDSEVRKVFQVFVEEHGKTVPKDIWSFSTVKGVSRYAKVHNYIDNVPWLETVSEEILGFITSLPHKQQLGYLDLDTQTQPEDEADTKAD